MTTPALQPLDEAGFDEAFGMLSELFGEQAHPADRDAERSIIDPERWLAGRDEGEVVATCGAFAMRLSVPGGELPTAGITWVGVRATHRRRGLLTAMVTRLLHDAYGRGEPLAALHASEGAIYQRFGFGPAAWGLAVTVPQHAAFAREVPLLPVRRPSPTPELLSSAYDTVRKVTPGLPQRDQTWWDYRLHDPEHGRDGGTPLRCAVTDGGFLLYSTKMVDDQANVRVRELTAATPAAHATLWRYVLDLDLAARTTARVAADDPLLQLLAEPRAARGRLSDRLWARPVELGAALGGRAYAAPLDVVLDVTDRTCPWNAGRWRLAGDRTGASCARTPDPADLTLGIADLGAAYLGGTPLRSRPVTEHTAGALAAASTAFGPVAAGPWSPLTW